MFPPLVPDLLLAGPGLSLTTIPTLQGFKMLGPSHTWIHPLATLCRYYGCFGDNSSLSRSDIGFQTSALRIRPILTKWQRRSIQSCEPMFRLSYSTKLSSTWVTWSLAVRRLLSSVGENGMGRDKWPKVQAKRLSLGCSHSLCWYSDFWETSCLGRYRMNRISAVFWSGHQNFQPSWVHLSLSKCSHSMARWQNMKALPN